MRYVDFLDIDVNNIPSLGKIDFDYDLARIATLKTAAGAPLVSHWLDPLSDLAVPVEQGVNRELVRDAASQQIYTQPAAATRPVRSAALNGQPTLEFAAGALPGYYPHRNANEVNTNAWSALAVFNVPVDSTDSMAFISKGDDESVGAGKLWPSLRLVKVATGDQLGVAEVGTNTLRTVSAARTGLRGRTCVALATFSTSLGVSVYLNGTRIANNPADVRPLTRTTVGFLANTPFNGTSMPAIGQFGWQMMFRDDLSSADNAGARAVIHEIVMRRYGISL